MTDLTALPTFSATASPVTQQSSGISNSPPIATVVQQSTQNTTLLSSLQYLSENPKYYFSMNVGQFSRDSATTVISPGVVTQSAIIMPLPENISDHYSVDFDQTPLGAVLGMATNQYMKTQQDGASTLGSVVSGIAAGGAALVGTGILKLPFAQGSLATSGYASNQFLTIMLKGPKYKQFNFTWKFSPRNVGESQRLNMIINYLKNCSAPGLALSGFLFTFPYIFQLSFQPNPQYNYKFKPAVLIDIQVNYSASGAPSYFRGSTTLGTDAAGNGLSAPSQIAMSLTFLELEFWLQGEWRDTNLTTDVEGPTSNFNPLANLNQTAGL